MIKVGIFDMIIFFFVFFFFVIIFSILIILILIQILKSLFLFCLKPFLFLFFFRLDFNLLLFFNEFVCCLEYLFKITVKVLECSKHTLLLCVVDVVEYFFEILTYFIRNTRIPYLILSVRPRSFRIKCNPEDKVTFRYIKVERETLLLGCRSELNFAYVILLNPRKGTHIISLDLCNIA